ncbi:MAG: hypothetical protein OEM27_07715 [Nitrospinota bacterium]|nr:hypothetical protein [Nitrospinota bacterium]
MMRGNETLLKTGLTGLFLSPAFAQASCGEKIMPLGFYEDISLYSLIAGFILVFAVIFLEKKKIKMGLGVAAVLPFLAWGYVNFLVDYNKIRKTIFNYNVQAEATLANIAEAQERYQSEQGNFITDLKVLESHLAGAHGMDECVRIVELNASFGHWSAVAQHYSSPDTVRWDSTSGSSLKKG